MSGGLTGAEPSHVRQKMTRNERNDSARRRRQDWRWKCQTWRRSMTGDEFWTYDATDGSWKTSDTVTQRCSMPVNCVPKSSARAAPSGTNWNQHGIYAEHKGHKGWDTCANSSSHDEEHPKQHRVQCHDHPWKRHMTVNISHVERRQHPPPFAESHEGKWTAEQPGHRQGGRQP